MSRTHRHSGAPIIPRRSSALPFALATHAVDRFHERIARGLSWAHARYELRVLAASARKTDERTPRGHEVWVATDGEPIRFVVRDHGGLRTCVTVLGAAERGGEEPEEDVA